MKDCGKPGGLQEKLFKASGDVDNSGDKDIADFREILSGACTGADAVEDGASKLAAGAFLLLVGFWEGSEK